MNMDNMSYSMRNMMNNGRPDEMKFDQNTIDMMNASNQSYMMNGTVLTNQQQQMNEYGNEMDKYPADMMSQMKLDQVMNSYNNTMAMSNMNGQEQNEAMLMQAMNTNMENGYESYRNFANYNNTQNTIKTNQIPLNMEDFNNSEAMYMNPNGMDMYSDEFIKNLPETNDGGMGFNNNNNFQMQNWNYNQMAPQQFSNFQYQMPGYENMTNSQMVAQPINAKQTRNVPLPNMSNSLQPNMSQLIQPKMQQQQQTQQQHLVPSASIRKFQQNVPKRKMKPKKFFPCC